MPGEGTCFTSRGRRSRVQPAAASPPPLVDCRVPHPRFLLSHLLSVLNRRRNVLRFAVARCFASPECSTSLSTWSYGLVLTSLALAR